MQFGPKRFLNIRERPFELFGLAAVLMFILWLIPTKASLDVNLHDSYFVFSSASLFYVLTTTFLFIWLIYLVSDRILFSKILTWAHTILTILTSALLLIFITFNDMIPGTRGYYAYNEGQNPVWVLIAIYGGLFITLGLSQLILVFNLLAGLIKSLIRSY